MITVNEIMSSHVTTLNPSDSIAKAKALMQQEHIRHIPIVDENRSPVGLLSQRDVLKAESSPLDSDQQNHPDENTVPVSEIMVNKIICVHPEDPLRSAGLKLQKHKYGCLPVIKENQLVGIITDSDFVSVAINLIEQMEISEDY